MAVKRATNLAELGQLFNDEKREEVLKKGLQVKLRESDVVITPYGKSGTTWTQQIVHTLRTRGDMDFDDISRVVPWIEVSAGLGIDLEGLVIPSLPVSATLARHLSNPVRLDQTGSKQQQLWTQ